MNDKLLLKRNYGIDFLRIVAMMMVCLRHTIAYLHIPETIQIFSIRFEIFTLLNAFTLCAVNSFAIISGYVGYGHKFKYSKLFYIWFQVVFYGLGLSLLFMCISPGSVGLQQIFTNCFPVLFCKNWYFTAYFCMCFFIPFINILLDNLNCRKLSILILVSVFLFSVLQNIPINKVLQGEVFLTNNGHSAIWLSVLYIIGAYIKKYKQRFRKPYFYLLMYLITSVLTFFYQNAMLILTNSFFNTRITSEDVAYYTSPTVLLSAIFLVLFFCNLRFNSIVVKAIAFFAPAQFGVLLIHANGNLSFVFSDFLKPLLNQNECMMLIQVVAIAVLIWLLCSLIDKIRNEFFKLIKIMSICKGLEKVAYIIMDKATLLFIKAL